MNGTREVLADHLWLIIGGAGFIGGHLVDDLLENGNSVTVIDDFSMGRYRNPKARYLKADVRDKRKITRFIRTGEYDVVVGAWATKLLKSLEDPFLANDVNSRAALNVLDALLRTEALYIHLSTGSVYGHGTTIPNREDGPTVPSSTYGVSKLAGEAYVRAYSETYGLKTTTLRLHSVYGSRQAYTRYGGVVSIFIRNILLGKQPVIFGDGHETRPFLYVHDAIRAILIASLTPGAWSRAINIAGDKSYSINYLANLILRLMGSTLRPIHMNVDRPTVKHFHSSLATAKELLKFYPKVDLYRGLRLTIDAERQTLRRR